MKIKILCSALLLLPSIAMAFVNPKNGNFSTSFTDILKTSKGHELDLTRTYNSKSTHNGWFGFGWGTPFESRLLVMPDGSVIVKENGTGETSRYAPKTGRNLQAGVERIVAEAIRREALDAGSARELRDRLLASEDLREARVVKYGIKTEFPKGSTVQANACTDAAVNRIGDEYRRTNCGFPHFWKADYFDLAGRLIRRENDDFRITIHYAGMYPDRIEDSQGQKLFLKWTASGHVAEVRAEKPEIVIRYSYDERGNLLMSNQVQGNYHRYEYDGKHNLTRITYIDNGQRDIRYDENSLATSVTEPDGSKTVYAYRSDPTNPSGHYWTAITEISPSGVQSSREEEFFLTTDAAGVEKLAGSSKTVDQIKQDIVYDEKGRIKLVKKSDGVFAEYFYDPTLNKVSHILTDKGRTDYRYNAAGELIRANNSRGQVIELGYDGVKRINRMVETNESEKTRRELMFKYNDLGKPVNITLVGKGEITVTYDQEGEILTVASKQGAAMALEVSKAFDTLLDVVKAGGVDLSM